MVGLARFLGVKMILEEDLQFYRIHGGNTSSYFLNTPQATSPLLLKIRHKLRPGGKDWLRKELSEEGENLERFEDRLLELTRMGTVASVKREQIEGALETVSSKIVAIRKRRSLLAHGRLSRIVPAIRLWRRSDYVTHFNGVHSFIRDMMA